MQSEIEESDDGPAIGGFLCSEGDGGRRHLTTLGLLFRGLPELQMKEVAANHLRAARFLMNTVARKLRAEHLPSDGVDAELSLDRRDVSPGDPFVGDGRFPEVGDDLRPARVRLVLEPFAGPEDEGYDPPQLLSLRPPRDHRGDADQWLREACRRLGQDAPPPLAPEDLPRQMQAASERARARLPAVARRFREGCPPGAVYLVKTELPTQSDASEYVWFQVEHWLTDGVLVGELLSELDDAPGCEPGQRVQLHERDVFDYAVHTDSGEGAEASRTDLLAQEFGLDLHRE